MTERYLEHDRRPWGQYFVLDEGRGFKVKRIEVLPGQRLSYQKHEQRAEHWVIVAGRGTVTLDGDERSVTVGDAVDVAPRMAHRIRCDGDEPLVFVEVQRGRYLGEDDITRLSDDYGRSAAT